MAKLYVTFGQVHAHSVNGKTFDKDTVAVVNVVKGEGRKRVFELFGDKFFTTYAKEPDMQYFPKGLVYID